jgi:hypothetical protein
VRKVTVSRGSVPEAYLSASVEATTSRSEPEQRALATAVEVEGDGDTEGVAAGPGCDEPPEQATAIAAIRAARKASTTIRRVQ